MISHIQLPIEHVSGVPSTEATFWVPEAATPAVSGFQVNLGPNSEAPTTLHNIPSVSTSRANVRHEDLIGVEGKIVAPREFLKADLVQSDAPQNFDPSIVPDATHAGDRHDLRQWIPKEHLQNGKLSPAGLYIVNMLTCVQLSARTARRHRREGIVVVPPGHEELDGTEEEDMWCLLCHGCNIEREEWKAVLLEGLCGKRERHAWYNESHREAIARALGIAVQGVPEGGKFKCPFYENPLCGDVGTSWSGAVLEQMIRECQENPHSDHHQEVYEPIPFPDDPVAYLNALIWGLDTPQQQPEPPAAAVQDENADVEMEDAVPAAPPAPEAALPLQDESSALLSPRALSMLLPRAKPYYPPTPGLYPPLYPGKTPTALPLRPTSVPEEEAAFMDDLFDFEAYETRDADQENMGVMRR